MKALIRQENEVILETTALRFIDWSTGAPLTNEAWAGGPYVLVENFDPTVCEVVNPDEFAKRAGVEIAETPAPETVTIDGKTYTKDELLALLNQTV